MSRPLRRSSVAALVTFLVALSFALFVDAVRVQKESRDPGSLPPVDTGLRPLARHVLLVLIDSLPERIGNDEAIMPNLVALGKAGAHGVMIAPPDTVTTAGVRAMSVGTKPGFSDTLELFSHKHYSHWTVFDDVVKRGQEVAFFGDHTWTDLLGDRARDRPESENNSSLYGSEDVVFADARSHLKLHGREGFTAVHIAKTDFYAHQWGTEREEYRRAMRAMDARIGDFISEFLDDQTTVIVTSDHGNDFYGNHGGSGDIYRRVPLVLLGAGIKPLTGFEMEGRQLPLALAILLGTRLPGGIAKPLPPPFLNLSPAQIARLEGLDLARLKSIASFLGAGVPAGASRAEVVGAIESSSRPDPGLLLWPVVLFLALALSYLAIGTPLSVAGLLSGAGLALLLCLSSKVRVPLLGGLVALELGLLVSSKARLRVSVILGALAIAVVSGVRFHLGGHAVFALAKVAVLPILLGAAAIAWRAGSWRKVRERAGQAVGWAVPVALVALALLQPVEIVPVLLCTAATVAALAAGVGEAGALTAAVALCAFFVFSQRFGFGWTGERIGVRYLYALAAGGLLACALNWRTGRRGHGALFAFLCLVPLWAFGFLHLSRSLDSAEIQLGLNVLAFGAAALFTWRTQAGKAPFGLLAVGLAYHFHPEVDLFWGAVVLHVAALAIESRRRGHGGGSAAILLSFLYLTSPGAELISVILLCAVPLLALDRESRLGRGALLAVAAVLVVYVRYGIFDSFGHAAGAPYSLGNIDTHSGFAAIEGNVDVWVPTILVFGKMFCASALVFLLVLKHPRQRQQASSVFVASLALVLAFVLEASIEIALSFGRNDSRVSMSMVQMIVHAGLLIIIAGGYGIYRVTRE